LFEALLQDPPQPFRATAGHTGRRGQQVSQRLPGGVHHRIVLHHHIPQLALHAPKLGAQQLVQRIARHLLGRHAAADRFLDARQPVVPDGLKPLLDEGLSLFESLNLFARFQQDFRMGGDPRVHGPAQLGVEGLVLHGVLPAPGETIGEGAADGLRRLVRDLPGLARGLFELAPGRVQDAADRHQPEPVRRLEGLCQVGPPRELHVGDVALLPGEAAALLVVAHERGELLFLGQPFQRQIVEDRLHRTIDPPPTFARQQLHHVVQRMVVEDALRRFPVRFVRAARVVEGADVAQRLLAQGAAQQAFAMLA
jgi:hypothetical protein